MLEEGTVSKFSDSSSKSILKPLRISGKTGNG
jgi:hypothetical protein